MYFHLLDQRMQLGRSRKKWLDIFDIIFGDFFFKCRRHKSFHGLVHLTKTKVGALFQSIRDPMPRPRIYVYDPMSSANFTAAYPERWNI